jgi:hypothetical protein
LLLLAIAFRDVEEGEEKMKNGCGPVWGMMDEGCETLNLYVGASFIA